MKNRGFIGSGLAAIITVVLIAGGIFIAEWIDFHKNTAVQTSPTEASATLGAQLAVAGIPYYLYGSGVGLTDTSITLTSFKQPVNSYLLSMTDFGDIGYITLEPGNVSRQEFVSFTGVTQNSDGTATLTGVTRGLAPVSPYTASTTIRKAHAGGSTVVVSNPPQFYERFANKTAAQFITAVWTYMSTTSPKYLYNPSAADWTASASTTLASKGYVDDQVTAGCSNANTTTRGCVEIATRAEAASSTNFGGTGAWLVLGADIATDTPAMSSLSASRVVMSDMLGYISWDWLNHAIAQTWTALHTFSGGLTSSATTTAACSNVLSVACVFNGIAYKFPSFQPTASSTAMVNDGTGNLYWDNPSWQQIGETTLSGAAGSTTLSISSIVISPTCFPASV